MTDRILGPANRAPRTSPFSLRRAKSMPQPSDRRGLRSTQKPPHTPMSTPSGRLASLEVSSLRGPSNDWTVAESHGSKLPNIADVMGITGASMPKLGAMAVIPARGGSKRVPRKNIRLLNGKPLIGWTIELALESEIFTRVVVSTDDTEVADISRDFGAEIPFLRPLSLSNDSAPVAPVLRHALSTIQDFGDLPEYCCCLYPTAVLIRPDDLRQSLAAQARSLDRGYVLGITPYRHPIQRAFTFEESGRLTALFPGNFAHRTQDLDPTWHDAGQFCWGHTSAWLNGLDILNNAVGYPLEPWRVVDVDTEEDWSLLTRLHKLLSEVPTTGG